MNVLRNVPKFQLHEVRLDLNGQDCEVLPLLNVQLRKWERVKTRG